MVIRRLPLRYRLPNAPASFVGRAREAAWLRGAIVRGPVSVVCGPSGIGKTAIALSTLHQHFADRVEHTVWIGVRPGDQAAHVRLALAHALDQVTGAELDLRDLQGDPEGLVEVAIDLAERHQLWVVVDDAHNADSEELGELLTHLASYSRASRFVVTMRYAPSWSALAGQVLTLESMPEEELWALGRTLAPEKDPTQLHLAARAAAGSPWLLAQLALGERSSGELTREGLLGGLPAEVDSALGVLALLRVPLSLDVLATLVALPAPAVLQELEQRGILVRAEGGVRLHDMAAGLITRGTEEAVPRGEIARALADAGPAELAVEAVRLLLEVGEIDAAVHLLDQRAAALFSEGQAPRLFGIIGQLRDVRLAAHQLRAASEMGNPTALGSVLQPEDPREALGWAQVAYESGEVAGARTLALEERRRAQKTSDLSALVEATALGVRCLVHGWQLASAEQEMAGLRSSAEMTSPLRQRALTAWLGALLARPAAEAEALELAAELHERASTDISSLHDVASALAEWGRIEAADELIDLILATPRGARTSLLVSRKALALRAGLRLERGRLQEASVIIEQLRPYLNSTTLLRPQVLAMDVCRRLQNGELAGAAEALRVARSDARRCDLRTFEWTDALREEWALISGEALLVGEAPLTAVTDRGAEAQRRRARRQLRATGATDPLKSPAVGPGPRVWEAILEAERAALSSDFAAAVETATRARQLARPADLVGLEAAAAACLCDVLAMAGRHTELEVALADFAGLAERLGSLRFRGEAEVLAQAGDPAVLERLAAESASPIAARRAAALLGESVVLDSVDRKVVEGVSAPHPSFRPQILFPESAERAPGWGLDYRSKRVWVVGRSIELEARPLLWKMLEVLASSGGHATKEALVVNVWGEVEYHPGRHDPRLHMTVRKLREALEDNASAPTHLLTTEVGYRLAGRLRTVR